MESLFWIFVFIVSIAVLIKSADFFTSASEEIGIVLRLPLFVIGVTIVGLGTSMPEFASSLVATLRGDAAFLWANVIGSNIANILLIMGFAALMAGVIRLERDVINEDLPLLAAGTALTIFVLWDGALVRYEAVLLLVALAVYFWYALSAREQHREVREVLEESRARAKSRLEINVLVVCASLIGIYLGAEYTVVSVRELAGLWGISPAIIAVTAVAIGTSLPELVVSVRAAMKKKFELAVGNIIGSNLLNMFFVGGLVGLGGTTVVVGNIARIGLPVMGAATLLVVLSGISKNYQRWDGAVMLLLYLAFIAKLFA